MIEYWVRFWKEEVENNELKDIVKFKCPGCEQWGTIDDDQYHGRVSILCAECGFHETLDLSKIGKEDEDEKV